MCTVDGQLRPVVVRDRSVAAVAAVAEKADRNHPGHVAAPFQGTVTVTVALGDTVKAGDPVATIEAMKMEAAIASPTDGTVARVAIPGVSPVDGGDLLLVVDATEQTRERGDS
jgi:pyruvate carboxylase